MAKSKKTATVEDLQLEVVELKQRIREMEREVAETQRKRDAIARQLKKVAGESGGRLCGVYVLLRQGQVQYVGQSINVFGRLSIHRSPNEWKRLGEFDEVRIHWCEHDGLNDLESRLIAEHRPLLNAAGNTARFRKSTRTGRTSSRALFGPGFDGRAPLEPPPVK